MPRAIACERGCGTRTGGGCYIEGGHSDWGVSMEDLLVDPASIEAPTEWLKPHRAPILIERGGVWHVVIWVGAEYYPNVWDFIEETRVAGASRKVSPTFDFAKMSDQSLMLFVHSGARVALPETAFAFSLLNMCPKDTHDGYDPNAPCLGVAKLIAEPDEGESLRRTIPCGASYAVGGWSETICAKAATTPGVFLRMSVTGVALVNHEDGSFNQETEARARQATAGDVEVFRTDA